LIFIVTMQTASTCQVQAGTCFCMFSMVIVFGHTISYVEYTMLYRIHHAIQNTPCYTEYTILYRIYYSTQHSNDLPKTWLFCS